MTALGDFSPGDVLTAADLNALPGGVKARATSTTSGTTASNPQLTTSFTAVIGRLYRITYYEGAAQSPAGAGNYVSLVIKDGATGLSLGQSQASGATQVANTVNVQWIGTLSAGSHTINADANANTGTTNLYRSASLVSFLLVEDIGPA